MTYSAQNARLERLIYSLIRSMQLCQHYRTHSCCMCVQRRSRCNRCKQVTPTCKTFSGQSIQSTPGYLFMVPAQCSHLAEALYNLLCEPLCWIAGVRVEASFQHADKRLSSSLRMYLAQDYQQLHTCGLAGSHNGPLC